MKRKICFSVDDTVLLFRQLSERAPKTIFELPTLSFFQKLHREYGAVVSFYAFMTDGKGFTLNDTPDCYREQFEENAAWLKFGVHASDYTNSFTQGKDDENTYGQIYAQLVRTVGERSIDKVFRPHFFRIDQPILHHLRQLGKTVGVHCPDDDRECHPFTEAEKCKLAQDGILRKDGILYVKSQTRLESLNEQTFSKFLQDLLRQKFISVFTHESFLTDEKILNHFLEICQFAKERQLVWNFPMNCIQ